MVFIIKLIGVLLIVLGGGFLFNPESMKKVWAFFEKGQRLYLVGVSRILIGIVFLFAASACRLKGLIIFLGLLFLASGLMILYLGPEKVKKIAKLWIEKPVGTLRFLSLIVIAFGILILYAV